MRWLGGLVVLVATPALAQTGATVEPTGVSAADIEAGLADPARGSRTRGLHRPAPQPPDADHAGATSTAQPAVDVSDRNHAPGRGFETTPIVVDGVLYVTGLEQQRLGG